MTQEAWMPHTGNTALTQAWAQSFFAGYRDRLNAWPWQQSIDDWVDYILQFGEASEVSTAFIDPKPDGGQFSLRVDGLVLPGPDFSTEQYNQLQAAIRARLHLSTHSNALLQEGFVVTEKGQRHWVGRLQTAFGVQITFCFARPPSAEEPLTNWPEFGRVAVDQMQRHPYGGLIVCCNRYWSLNPNSIMHDVLQSIIDPAKIRDDGPIRTGLITESLQALPLQDDITVVCVDGSQQSWEGAARSLVAQDIDLIVMRGRNEKQVVAQAILTALETRLVLVDVSHRHAIATLQWLFSDIPISSMQTASVLRGVVGSYPDLRKVCPHCAIEKSPDSALLKPLQELGVSEIPDGQWTEGQGCSACHGTGYAPGSRLTLVEAIATDVALKQLLQTQPSEATLVTALQDRGMSTYFEQAFEFARQGETTLQEVVRVGMMLYFN